MNTAHKSKVSTYLVVYAVSGYSMHYIRMYLRTYALMPFAVCTLSGFVSVDHDSEEELQEGHLSQLETCLQCRTDHVCYDEGGRLVLLVYVQWVNTSGESEWGMNTGSLYL